MLSMKSKDLYSEGEGGRGSISLYGDNLSNHFFITEVEEFARRYQVVYVFLRYGIGQSNHLVAQRDGNRPVRARLGTRMEAAYISSLCVSSSSVEEGFRSRDLEGGSRECCHWMENSLSRAAI